jgi:hypothetical protein
MNNNRSENQNSPIQGCSERQRGNQQNSIPIQFLGVFSPVLNDDTQMTDSSEIKHLTV